MIITKKALAGTLESSDALVEIGPGSGGITIELLSVVEKQFGEVIRQTIRQVLEELGVGQASVKITDRGALDCTIRARIETAVRRAVQ